MTLDVLVVEPYLGGSHAAWAAGLARHSRHRIETIELPGRWWKWRMRGGAVTVADRAAILAGGGYRPDVVLVSGMIDLALLRAMLDGIWGRIPTALYLHESQLTYPDSPQMRPDASFAFINWTSALVADHVAFNSGYHRDVFFRRIELLLGSFPDYSHVHHVDSVREKSSVLPVGVDFAWIDDSQRLRDGGPPIIMWNHRWEHDKDPTTFLSSLDSLSSAGVEFRVALCGENFRQQPSEFVEAGRRLGDRVVAFGHADEPTYRRLLLQSEVVVSTALQEFFGTSIVEAAAAGAAPVLPDRLSYPWLIPEGLHDRVLYPDGQLSEALHRVLTNPSLRQEISAVLIPEMRHRFAWESVIGRYDFILDELSATPIC